MLDARIPLGVQPVQIQSPLDAMTQIAQLQAQRAQVEDRAIAAQERRAKAQEDAAKHLRQAQVEQTVRGALRIDPATGRPTLDWPTLLGADVPTDKLFELDTATSAAVKGLTELESAQIDLGTKKAQGLALLARPVALAGFAKPAYDAAVLSAFNRKLITAAEKDAGLALTDPAQIQASVERALAGAGDGKDAPAVGGLADFLARYAKEHGTTVEAMTTADVTAAIAAHAAATRAPTAAAGFTLTPGAIRYGPNGEVIASRPPAPTAGGGGAGFTLSPGQTRYGPDGKPIATAAGAGADGGVKLSPGLQDDIATMLTVQDLGKSALTLGDQIKWRGTGPVAGRIGAVGAQFGAGGEDPERLRNLIGNIQGTIAKLRGGTAFSAQEQRMLESYTPTPTDSVLQIKAKLKSLDEFITAKRENLLRVAGGQFTPRDTPPPPPAGGRGGGPGLTYQDYLRSRGGR